MARFYPNHPLGGSAACALSARNLLINMARSAFRTFPQAETSFRWLNLGKVHELSILGTSTRANLRSGLDSRAPDMYTGASLPARHGVPAELGQSSSRRDVRSTAREAPSRTLLSLAKSGWTQACAPVHG